MSFVAEASCIMAVLPEVAFDRLSDHGSWSEWMPPTFRPVGASLGTLTVGAKPKVRIVGVPGAQPLRVTVVDRAREITWCGGSVLLNGEHQFLFEPVAGGKTRVRSVETWRGFLAPLLKLVVKPAAERVGRDQLAALAKSVGG